MRGVLQQIVVFRLLSIDDFLRFLTDFDHSIAESIVAILSFESGTAVKNVYLSISSKDSDSVGSINIAVGIGHEQVGGWNP